MSRNAAVGASQLPARRRSAEAGVEAAFRQCHREPAFRAVVRRSNEPGRDAIDQHPLQRRLTRQIERRRNAPNQAVHDLQILAAAKLVRRSPEQHHRVARPLKRAADDRDASSMTPTTPRTGVGSTASPSVSL